MILWFVRHGESEATAMKEWAPAGHDLPLTEVGRAEAQAVAELFRSNKTPLSAVYASTLMRAVQTAEPTAEHYGLALTKDVRLCERDWGIMNALTWPEVATQLSEMPLEDRYIFEPEGGESWAQMEMRVMEAVQEIQSRDLGDVAIFTHGGVLRGLLPVLARVDKSEHERFTLKTGGIARYDTEADSVEIIA